MRQVPGKAGKSSLWVRVGCRDIHGWAREYRDICSIAQARSKQGQSPTRLLPAAAHAALLPATWEHICTMSELAEHRWANPEERRWMGGKKLQSLLVHWRPTLNASVSPNVVLQQ